MTLGEAQVTPERLAKILKGLTGKERPDYLTRRQAIELAEKCQPGDPENPNKPFLNDLRIEIDDLLQEKGIEGKIEAYTAVGTPLDHLHGVDAFIKVTVDGRSYICTIDVTLNTDKQKHGHKADLIVGRLPDPNMGEPQEEAYLHRIETIAKDAVEHLLQQVDEDSGDSTRRKLFGENRPSA